MSDAETSVGGLRCLQAPARIETARLVVRAVEEADIAALVEVNQDDSVTQYLPYASWRSLDDGTAWLQRMRKLEATGTGVQLAILEKHSGRAIGTSLLFRHEAASARAELGYVLGRRHWGQRLMHEALAAIVAQVFIAGALRRLEAEVNPLNGASCRVLERLGFRHEGLLRQRWVAKGATYDTSLYGLLRDEWRPADIV